MLRSIDAAFLTLDTRSRELLARLDDDELFLRPDGSVTALSPFSSGEYLLRSAAMVEKTFGGITTRLWDDPFEWTLPEKLATRDAIIEYLDEVEATRKNGFAFFTSDDDLRREIPAPERLRPLAEILIGTLLDASQFQGQAFAVFQVITGKKPPRF